MSIHENLNIRKIHMKQNISKERQKESEKHSNRGKNPRRNEAEEC